MTCRVAREEYHLIQSRLRELRAKNVDSRRKWSAIATQLKATKRLQILSLINVNHPCQGPST
jgi:hypothetical protein